MLAAEDSFRSVMDPRLFELLECFCGVEVKKSGFFYLFLRFLRSNPVTLFRAGRKLISLESFTPAIRFFLLQRTSKSLISDSVTGATDAVAYRMINVPAFVGVPHGEREEGLY